MRALAGNANAIAKGLDGTECPAAAALSLVANAANTVLPCIAGIEGGGDNLALAGVRRVNELAARVREDSASERLGIVESVALESRVSASRPCEVTAVDLLDELLRVEAGKVWDLNDIEVAAVTKVVCMDMLASGNSNDVAAIDGL